VGLELGPLSLVSTTEELLDRKVGAPVYKTENTAVGIRHADHVAPTIRKIWQSLRRQAAVARSVSSRTQTMEFSFLAIIKYHQFHSHKRNRADLARSKIMCLYRGFPQFESPLSQLRIFHDFSMYVSAKYRTFSFYNKSLSSETKSFTNSQ
jgi:hypothetical protein